MHSTIICANFNALKHLSRICRNYSTTKYYQKLSKSAFFPRIAFCYSTVVPKQFCNMLDIFTDIFSVTRSNNWTHLEPVEVVDCVLQNKTEAHKIDKLVARMDLSNMQTSVKILINELQSSIELKDWNGVDRILLFLIDKKIALGRSIILNLAEEFCNAGFTAGLKSLLSLVDVIKDEHSIRGEVLLYLAKCYFKIGNVRECLTILRDSYNDYADFCTGFMRKSLRSIIYESVSSRSDAVLFNVVKFVEELTEKYHDPYFITVLWNDLFMSEWHSNHQIAESLLTKYEHLRTNVAIMASTLAQGFIKRKKFADVYRLLEILLKHKMMEPYANITQMLYDYYCMKGDKFRCSEIIKSSITLKIPLREEQYNSFISWSVSGNPCKFIRPIERIH